MEYIAFSLLALIFVLLIFLVSRLKNYDLTDLKQELSYMVKNYERLEKLFRDEIGRIKDDTLILHKGLREELNRNVFDFTNTIRAQMSDMTNMQKNQFEIFSNQLSVLVQTLEQRLDRINVTVENRLKMLQDDTNKKLEDMRAIVDNKLHETLEKRLGESFKLVSERLEQVHKGLGEMQNLASSVGDLKNILSNVKTRGIWGEIQLENLLSQILSPDQYAKNVQTKKGSNERVEFAIKLPGKNDENSVVWLPIDAKFPQEDYQRLLNFYDKCDEKGIEEAKKQLEKSIKKMCR